MAESMIERVARTLASHHYGVRFGKAADDPHVLRNVDGNLNIFLEPARAAIEAMRTPTEAMSRVLGDAAKYGTRSNGEVGPKDLMSDLIDAALKEQEGEKR
jgi:hypothetical protein